MFFTQDDYKKIQQWLTKNSVKDTEFNEANIPFNGEETITIVQGNQNKKVFLKDLIAQVFNLGISDFVNITDKYDAPNISLEEAIRLIPSRARKEGQVITFLDRKDHWHIYQFKGALNQWNILDTWEDLFDWEKLIIDSILPDEEDLTKSLPDANGNSYLSLKDREYNPEDFSGLGRIILRKNIIEVEDPIYGKVKKNVLYQDMFTQSNTIYEIRYDFDLNGEEITIPEGCVLDFQGGSLSNGNTILQNTKVKSTSTVFYNLTLKGSVKDNTINDFYFPTIEETFVNGYNVGATVIFNSNHKIGGDVLSEIEIPSIKGNGFLLETENIIFLNDNNSISVSEITISSNIYADIDNEFPNNASCLIKASNAKNVYLNNVILKQKESSSLYRTLGLVKCEYCSNIILTNIITFGSHLPFRLEYCNNITADNIKINNYETGFWLTRCDDVSITNIVAKNNPDTEYNWWIGCNSTTKNNGKDTILASGKNYYISNVVSYYPIERTGYLNINDSVIENITSYNGTVKVSGHEDYIVENVQVSNIRTIHNKPLRNRNVSMLTAATFEAAFTTYFSKNIKVKDVYWDLCEGVDYIAGEVISMSNFVENIDISNVYATNSANKDVYGFLSMHTTENSSNVFVSNVYLKNIGKKVRYRNYASMLKVKSDLTIDNLNVLYDKTNFLPSDLIDTSIWEDMTYTPYIVIKNSNISLYANITDAIDNGVYNSFPCVLVNTTLNYYSDYGANATFKDIITSFFNTIKIQSAFNLTINYKGKTAFIAKVRDFYYINDHDYNTAKTLYSISDAMSDFEVIPNNYSYQGITYIKLPFNVNNENYCYNIEMEVNLAYSKFTICKKTIYSDSLGTNFLCSIVDETGDDGTKSYIVLESTLSSYLNLRCTKQRIRENIYNYNNNILPSNVQSNPISRFKSLVVDDRLSYIDGNNRLISVHDALHTADKPSIENVPIGYTYFDKTTHKPVWSDGEIWRTSDGSDTEYKRSGVFENKPENPYRGYAYLCVDKDNPDNDATNHVMIFYDEVNKRWMDALGRVVDENYGYTSKVGTTSERPSNLDSTKKGFQYFDTSLKKPIYWTGSKWVDATGADV